MWNNTPMKVFIVEQVSSENMDGSSGICSVHKTWETANQAASKQYGATRPYLTDPLFCSPDEGYYSDEYSIVHIIEKDLQE